MARVLEVEADLCHERGEFGGFLVDDLATLVSVKPETAGGKDRSYQENDGGILTPTSVRPARR
ncbi:MAG: hypothetical protein H6887_05730 [Hoeflea sp.]|nr:hypothetical protein [Hoeflea sp.]